MSYTSEAWAIAAAALLLSCAQDELVDQPRYEPLEASAWFDDGSSARPPIPGTIPHGHLPAGFEPPERVTAAALERGRRDYAILCTPCHGQLGDGDGMAVRRGFPRPAPFTDPRLRAASLDELIEGIGHGEASTLAFDAYLDPLARWRVAQWIRVLQLSQHVPVERLGPEQRRELEALDDSSGGAR
ncbi:c-type cytochrome [Enhygromyxa salina]|uniref:Cytochrome c domain-containing protein n=1 Tax=Enhygromyxa salina TaxID=215803 RepID=A0A2S9YPA2_9BACT|nr:cytochrome C [Enhygromyxa salina]PRQ06916.1 hypothetical protein ENSA7_33400 [Enhygromyxa salina]